MTLTEMELFSLSEVRNGASSFVLIMINKTFLSLQLPPPFNDRLVMPVSDDYITLCHSVLLVRCYFTDIELA